MVCIKTLVLNPAPQTINNEARGQKGRDMGKSDVVAVCHGWLSMKTCRAPCHPAERLNAVSPPLRCCQHAPSDPWSMMNALARSETLTQRKARSASDLHVDCCPMHAQRLVASWAIQTAAISILY